MSPALSSQLGLATGADIPPLPSATACRIPLHAFNSSPFIQSLHGMRWRPISSPITALGSQ